MKKILSVLIVLCLLPQMCTATVLGNSIYTDIATYINHYPIPSYHFGNLTLINAEDLGNYGFDVKWNEYAQSLTITRNKDKEISEFPTFRPEKYLLGKKELTITDTNIKVFYKGYQLSSFYGYLTDQYGGYIGYTLINVDDLACFENTTVTWVPETQSVKVWIEDGMPIKPYFNTLRRFDWGMTTWGNIKQPTYYWWQWKEYSDFLVLSVAETLYNRIGNYVDDWKRIEITDVIDADGNSILKSTLSHGESPSMYGYYLYFTDYLWTSSIMITSDNLLPRTAKEPGGLIKFNINFGDVSDTIRVNQLPYGD